MDARAGRWTSLALPGVLALVPFEPRSPTLALGPFHFTVLEGVALLAMGGLAWRAAASGSWRRRPALPVLLLALFALVELVSAAVASDDPAASSKFALRMAFMAVFAAGAALTTDEERWRALAGLAVGGLAASLLAVAEGAGLRALDPALAAFREMPFNVAGVRRATAGSEYPNLGAACIAYGLLSAVAWAARRRWSATPGVLLAAPFALGLLYTYSRGALVALAAALMVAAAVLADADRAGALPDRAARAVVPGAALAALAAIALVFTAAGEVFQLRLGSEGVDAWYGARYEPEARALTLAPGAATLTPVKVTNTGRKAWTEEGQFHLSYHWYDVERRVAMDGGRTFLPRPVAPGQSALLVAEVRAPDRPGAYLLLWDMVQEQTSWFSGQGVRPAVVRVTVRAGATAAEAAALPAAAPPRTSGLAWRPGRGELWSLAARMWRAHPLLGVGPDRFRRLYGPWAGRAWWDDRVYANNTLLEVAATAGSVAAALLAAAIGTAWLLAWRARRDVQAVAQAAALGALLAFAALHGLVDYLLAFTGHYLVLGFTVGAAAALAPRP